MTLIAKDVIARVREATDLVAIVSEHVSLKRSGRRYVGCCPFHPDKHPSLSVSQEMGIYYCFGCQAKGDAIAFVREIGGLDFVEAVGDLARRAGISIPDPDPAETERRSALTAAVAGASRWYHACLTSSSEALAAREYLSRRGIGDDVVKDLELGWAPASGRSLSRALSLSDELLVASGLGHTAPRGQRDHLKGRVVFPIRDVSGRPIGFIGRSLTDSGPKYLNTPDTSLYHKGSVLYGLDRAKADIVRQDKAVLCEGTIDVIACYAAGITNAVATCGTAVTEHHVRSLSRYSRRIVLAYDSDAAGAKAVERFYAWATTFDLDVQVAALPEGKDPGDLGFSDPDALHRAIEGAMPLLSWRVQRILNRAESDGQMSTPDQSVATAREAMRVVNRHPDPVLRAAWITKIAERCQVPESALVAGCPRRDEAPPASSVRASEGLETEVLRVAIHDPEILADVVEPCFFSDASCRKVFQALLDVDEIPEVLVALESGGEVEAADLFGRLTMLGAASDPRSIVHRFLAEMADVALARLVSAPHDSWLDDAGTTITRVREDIDRMCGSGDDADAAARDLSAWLETVLDVQDVAQDVAQDVVAPTESGDLFPLDAF